jgi:hypothetical protein
MRFQVERGKPGALPASDKRRLALLVGGFVVILGLLVTLLRQAQDTLVVQAPQAIESESTASALLVPPPEVDLARLAQLVHDRLPEDQVVLESEAADLLLASARRWTRAHYEAQAAPELDAALCADIAAAPEAQRGRPFIARGRIDALRRRTGAGPEQQFLGRLELPDGSFAHFLVLEAPELGGFVRVDGLFLKNYRSEDELEGGTWYPGPLLVGSAAEPSYPPFGPVRELDAAILSEVEDADLAPPEGQEPRLVRDTPGVPFWHLMAFARDLPADAIDWSAAPVLDQRLLDQLLEEPGGWRAQPVRIPISRLQDGRVKLAGENPARIVRYTQGWIGNTTWKNVIQFKSPLVKPELRIGDLVHGRGFFLHDLAYESAERGLRVAPVFVLQDLQIHVPRTQPIFGRIGLFVALLAAFLTVLFVVLLRRDRRRSAEFQEELLRRRRARRAGSKPDALGAGPAAP